MIQIVHVSIVFLENPSSFNEINPQSILLSHVYLQNSPYVLLKSTLTPTYLPLYSRRPSLLPPPHLLRRAARRICRRPKLSLDSI